MTTLTFPDIGAPARLRWRLISNTQVGMSPLSKSVQTYELPGGRWAFTAEWPPLEGERRRLARAFLSQLQGQAGRFTVHNWEAAEPAGSPNTPTGDTANLTFSLSLEDAGSGAVNTTPEHADGSSTATFTRATTATTVDSTGTIVSVASGVARSYYDPTTLEYMGYLAEGERTNLFTRSAQLDDATGAWTSARTTSTADQATAPDGTVSAELLTNDDAGGANFHYLLQNVALTQNTTYTISFFVKKVSGSGIVWLLGETSTDAFCYFNLNTGQVGTSTGFAAASIKQYQNGWYRISATFLKTSANASEELGIGLAEVDGTANWDSTGNANQEQIYVWGAQVEAGSFASSYIPTTTASVTRNMDQLSFPVAGNVSSTAGSIYAEVMLSAYAGSGNPRLVSIDGTGTGTGLLLNNVGQVEVYDGTTFDPSGLTVLSLKTSTKVACAWGGSTMKAYSNGVAGNSHAFDGSMNASVLTLGNHGTEPLFGAIKNVRIFSTKLSDANLQALPASDPCVFGASQTGKSLVTQNWTPSTTVLKTGDFFSVNGELKMMTADATSDSSGYATLNFVPPLRSSPANLAAIDFSSPQGTFMLTGDTSEWSVMEGNLFADFVIDAVEVF